VTNPRKRPTDRTARSQCTAASKGQSPPQSKIIRAEIQTERVLEALLETVRKEFYATTDTAQPKCHFHRDRRRLLHALSWPAHWLQARNLIVSAEHYRRIIEQQLAGIVEHGDRSSYQAYFPRYLLKCLQGHFRHRGDLLYEEVKAISYAIPGVIERLRELEVEPECSPASQRELVENLAALHGILNARDRKKREKGQNDQMRLF